MSAYADIDASGLRVSADETQPWVQFNDDARIALPSPCQGSVSVSIYGSMAIVQGWATGCCDRAYLVSRSGGIADLGVVAGTNGVTLTGEGPYIIRSEQKYTVGAHEHDVPTDHTDESIYGQGWTQILPDGEPNWFALQGVKVLGGVPFLRWSTVDHWTVGLDGTPNGPNRSIAHDARDNRVSVIREGTFLAPHVAVYADGSCEVALSLPAEWVTSDQFQPYAVPTPVPEPAPVPTPTPTPIPVPSPEVPSMPAPSFDQWIVKELREKIIPAHEAKHGKKSEEWKTGVEWGAFQTYRRNGTLLGLGENWTLEQIVTHERGDAPFQ